MSTKILVAVAAPPADLAPSVSGELAEAAARKGMSELEAAAFASLGVPLVRCNDGAR